MECLNEQAWRQLSKHMILGQRLMEALGTPCGLCLHPRHGMCSCMFLAGCLFLFWGLLGEAEAWVFPGCAVGGRGPVSPEDA